MNRNEHLMSAAIVKGIVEHKDATRFFGSLMIFQSHLEVAITLGVVKCPYAGGRYRSSKAQVTASGLEWYERSLHQLPQGRQVSWYDYDVGSPKGVVDES